MTRQAGPGRRARPAVGAAAVALGVILALVATIAAWVLFLTGVDGWVRLIWFGLGALFFWQLWPRRGRRSTRTIAIDPADAPELHRLVAEVAEVTETVPPTRVVVDTTYSIRMTPTGYLGHATLVIGLPQWTALDRGERLAALVHEFVCVDVRRRPVGRLVRVADDLLESLRTLLVPTRAVTPDAVAVHQTTSMMGALGPGDELAGNSCVDRRRLRSEQRG
ncbi:MAG: M48 family metallopeptidase [Dermatophilaceae bacterium]